MKKILYILLFLPLIIFGQEQDPCYSINDYNVLIEQSNPPISYQLTEGWNMVGYSGSSENNDIVTQINAALPNDATAESTFQVIKNVSGQFWSTTFAQLNNFVRGEGYMMYVISDSPPVLSFQNITILPQIFGCKNCEAFNFNQLATDDDGSCVDIVNGCTNELAFNYNSSTNTDDGSCIDVVEGCMDDSFDTYDSNANLNNDAACGNYGCTYSWAFNYESTATLDNASCEPFIYGCIDVTALNYNPEATLIVEGCMDALYLEYSASANTDNGSCTTLMVEGCMDATANNYNELATDDDGSCTYTVLGCIDATANNYNELATDDDGSCDYEQTGGDCPLPNHFVGNTGANMTVMLTSGFVSSLTITESNAYIVALNTDGLVVGSADLFGINQTYISIWGDDVQTTEIDGALANEQISFQLVNGADLYNIEMPTVVNYASNGLAAQVLAATVTFNCEAAACPYDAYLEYSSTATDFNVSACLTLVVEGCTDNTALNYNADANVEDNSCEFIYGCIDQVAHNYNDEATIDDGSCEFIYGCIDQVADNYNEIASFDDGTCIYYGCTDLTAGNYDEIANSDDGTCLIGGCNNATAENYNEDAEIDDGSCIIYGCILSDFPNYNSVATIGDGSCDMSSTDVFGCIDESTWTYQDIATIDNGLCNYSELEVGALGLGGIVFYIDETGEHGLVASLEDLGSYQWGCYGQSVSGADGTAIGTGYQNTLDIVSQNCQTQNGGITAAQATLNASTEGYTDWYLPSFDELYEMYNTIGNGGPEGNIGGFSNNNYWSSSENNNDFDFAWFVYFNNGYSNIVDKNATIRVRVIRAF